MHNLRTSLIALFIIAPLSGCDNRASTNRDPSPNSSSPTIAQDVAGIEADVRITQATKRIDDLEREVARLKTTPVTIDLDLFNQRMQAIEVKMAQGGDVPASLKAVPKSAPSPRPPKNTLKQPRAGLTLPELEKS